MQIAIDTGGTFTDCVYLQDGRIEVLKIFSTPEDPGRAVMQAVESIAADGVPWVRHGTTVGTNAVLERKGARVAFITTKGFEDTISIGRQARPHLYDWFAPAQPGIVDSDLCFGVNERTTPAGEVLAQPTAEELDDLAEKVAATGAEAIAISLLFSFANPANERKVASALSRLKLPISVSHRILPEFREYERASTVAVNAYLAPKMGTYLHGLASGLRSTDKNARFEVMQSSGGIIAASFAADQPVRTVLSGPAGGVMGAYFMAGLAGFEKIIAFDMGGTSTDVSLIDASEGPPRISNESVVSNMPIGVPMLHIHTVGAGGGSLAHFDAAGLLHVGPQSAGSNPGPICYGRGTQPTVSDANVILGRLDPDHFLGGKVRLDLERTRVLDGAGAKYDADGGSVCRGHCFVGRDGYGARDPRYLCGTRLRPSRVCAGSIRRSGAAACLRACQGAAYSPCSGPESAGCAFGCRHSARRYGSRLLEDRHACR